MTLKRFPLSQQVGREINFGRLCLPGAGARACERLPVTSMARNARSGSANGNGGIGGGDQARTITQTAKPPSMAVRKTKALPCAGLIHQKYGCKRNFVGLHFWARGYCVSTVGLDEAMVREYIRTQEEHEKKEEQIQLDY